MIITTLEELTLAAPAHALDTIDHMTGFIDNSEHEFLQPYLGTPLYEALCKWYADNKESGINLTDDITAENMSYYNRLLLKAQRCVAFDALGRGAGMQTVSVNNAGINQMSTDDYKPADDKTVAAYKETCYKEAHAAVNGLLQLLEQWCKEVNVNGNGNGNDNGNDNVNANDNDNGNGTDQELQEIVEKWKQSRYYYEVARILIPSAEVMQRFLNIYDNREKYIQMLPDLHFIQEEIIEPAISKKVVGYLIDYATNGSLPAIDTDAERAAARKVIGDGATEKQIDDLLSLYVPTDTESTEEVDNITQRMRKVVVAYMVGRTSVLKYSKEQKIQAHDDAVRMLETTMSIIRENQTAFPLSVIANSPLYTVPEAFIAPPPEKKCQCENQQQIDAYKKGDAACWTPPLF